jgi:hypothetical protein
MTHYLDLGFLLCLVTKSSGSRAAWEVVRFLPQPLLITSFQALQVENGLRKRMLGQDAKLQAVAARAWGNSTCVRWCSRWRPRRGTPH